MTGLPGTLTESVLDVATRSDLGVSLDLSRLWWSHDFDDHVTFRRLGEAEGSALMLPLPKFRWVCESGAVRPYAVVPKRSFVEISMLPDCGATSAAHAGEYVHMPAATASGPKGKRRYTGGLCAACAGNSAILG